MTKPLFNLRRKNNKLKNEITSLKDQIKQRDELLRDIYDWWDIDSEGVDKQVMDFCFRIRKLLRI